MKYQDNIQEVATLLPDYMGFIFYDKSPRFFNGHMPMLPKETQKIGVFVDAYLDDILEKIRLYNLQFVQLHGNESPKFCKLFKQTDVKVIKAFSIDETFNFENLTSYETVCDYFLFDTKGLFHGGNGNTFDWNLLQKYKGKKPIFLSGGISLNEIQKIKTLSFPIYAVDINSKFEKAPGYKNTQLINQFKNEISR